MNFELKMAKFYTIYKIHGLVPAYQDLISQLQI